MAVTTTANVALFLPKFYDKTFLEVFEPIPKAAEFCMQKPLPLHEGKVAYFPKMTATSDLPDSYIINEGTTITPETFVDEQIMAHIVQFANAKGITDFTEMTAIDSTTTEVVKNLATQANNLLDKQIIAAGYNSGAVGYEVMNDISSSSSIGPVFGGFPVLFAHYDAHLQTNPDDRAAGMVSAILSLGGVDGVMAADVLRKALGVVKAKDVTPLEKGYYAFLCHTDIAMTLLADSSITDLYKYTDPENLKKGIVGMYANALIVEDNNIAKAPTAGITSGAVYFNILLGRGALSVTKLDGGISTYTKPSGSAGSADPVNQVATFGWKANQAAVITNTSGGLIVAARA